MSTTNAIFNGSSQFSNDFQQIIQRSVAIASLPISALNRDVAALQSQSKDLQGIDVTAAALETAVDRLGDAMGGAALQATVSDSAVVGATVGGGATEGEYSIQVEDAGAYATSLTAASWVNLANLPGEKRTYQLMIGGTSYDITPTDNSAGAVARAINAAFGGQVRATTVNVGSADSPDYRISLQGTTLGDVALDIRDQGQSLQQQQTTGRQARYIVNGSGQTVGSNSRTVTISDGLNVELLASKPGQAVNITVVRSTSALGDALSNFARAYNGLVDSLDGQRGQAGGALAGQSLVFEVQRQLSSIATYNSMAAGSLAGIGLDLGQDGHLTFNSFTLMDADIKNPSGVTAFLGAAGTGGFLKWAKDSLENINNPASGLIKTREAALTAQTNATNAKIAAKQDQIDQLQQRLQAQMAVADAAIATLEQQYTYFSNMFQAQNAQQYK